PLVLMKRLSRFTYVADMLGEYVRRGVEADDMVAAKKQNRRCMFFATNGVPLPQDWVSVEQELRYIGMFAGLGVRSMHLTYQRRNMIGDGCGELGNAGLSDFGRAVVAEMNRVGVIIDVAHSGWRTSLEAARASSRPVVASHTGCVAVHNHVRCKPDEVIRAICDSGGFIGVFAVADFLGLSRDIVAMLAHVDHVVKHFGAEHVAIATDLVYVSRKSDEENKKIPRRRRPRKGWEKLWPPGAATTGYDQTRGLAWTNWPLFTVAMVQRGYSDTDIQKILGGNVLRVARAVMPRKISLEGLRTVVTAHAGDFGPS
ncbi:MAG TPA: membrane dipeptidase, partial [Clostridia bacterium]|nr:membrane dipeptidase [Clostridia bacterium]